MPALRMTLKSGTGQACAACKHQRRRCTPECLLAPFFPADQPKVFQSVHRLFGVKHVQNLLKELAPHEKEVAIKSIKFHAAMRDKYPVYGCLVEIQHLSYQIQLAEEELQLVLHQLAYYRQQQHLQQEEEMSLPNYLSQVQLGMAPPGNEDMLIVHHDGPSQQDIVTAAEPVPAHPSYSKNDNVDYSSNNLDYKENNDVDTLLIQQNDNSMALKSASQTMTVPPETVEDYNEMHIFFDDIDDRQSYIGSKEAYESSMESSFKDCKHTLEQMAENELKSAAACFTLTNVN